MYKNALTTAGITDADIIVAGPKPISGTAALVGIFEAYEAMTGEAVQDNVVDAALNELVVTGELEASIQGLTDQEVEEFIAYIKSLIAEKGLTDEKSINEAIDEACDKYGVTLSDDERQKIVDLLLKITSLGIDLSGLVDYAASLYNSFKMEEVHPESWHLLVISLEISLVRLGSSSKICLNNRSFNWRSVADFVVLL